MSTSNSAAEVIMGGISLLVGIFGVAILYMGFDPLMSGTLYDIAIALWVPVGLCDFILMLFRFFAYGFIGALFTWFTWSMIRVQGDTWRL